MHLSRRVALAVSPREELHILAREVFGPCFLSAIYEGLAMSYVNSWQGDDMETHAALLRSTGKLPSVAALLDEQRFRATPPEQSAVEAGVFITWIRQAYGVPGLKKMYGLADGRPAALAAALGTSEAELTPSFSSWADAKVAAHKNDLDFAAAEAEAQDKREVSDWKGMVTALQKALKAKPGDPQTLFNLASAQMRAADFTGAEASLKTMLKGPLGPGDSRFKIFGHYQLGRVYDLAHRRADAMAEYDAVLALPDDHGAHALAQERKISPATPEQLE
jgi:tetratricopeptide (TPR) repeat protein